MKATLYIFTILLFVSVNAQENNLSKKKLERIKKYSEQLTGSWKFIGLYKNRKIIESESQYSFEEKNGIKPSFYLRSTDSGYVLKKYVTDKLIEIKKTEIGNIEFEFENNGAGSLNEFIFGTDIDSGELFNDPHPPNPQIIFKNGKYILSMTEMLEQYEVYFRIRNDILVLKRKGEKMEKWYKKIE